MEPDLLGELQSSLGSAYRVERELPGGGMSRVFLAEEEALGRKVVIKVLPPELKGAVLTARFRREVTLAARLQHAHIVPLHSAGECNGLPFFTMPFVKGDSLRIRLARDGRLPVGETVRLLRELASALEHAHDYGIVHRDIKPDNILLSGGAAMVTDFGVAKAVETSTFGGRRSPAGDATSNDGFAVTSIGIALGTPAYMAPEQADGDAAIDHRADLYAFGVVAYEMLAGHPPFVGQSPQALIAAQISKVPEPISALRASIPPLLAALVMDCLAKLPAERPQSAREIIQRLDAITAEPQLLEPSRPGISRRVARQRRWVAAAALAVLAIVVLLVRPGSGPVRPRLAVLPFENLGQPADEYFADGLTEEITSRLATVPGLGIIGRSSVREYKRSSKSLQDIAADLRVSYVLTGSVRWERLSDGASRVRVSPHLIRVDDETDAWSTSFEGPYSDVFRFQTAVAQGVVDAMKVTLPDPQRLAVALVRTDNLDAYDSYLRGIASSTREHLFDAKSRSAGLAEFQRATELDPSFGAAHARLALGYVYESRFGGDRRALAVAQRHLSKAIELDSASTDTRLAQGWYLLERGEAENAHSVVQALMRVEPTNSQALYLDGLIEDELDQPEDAIESYQNAEALEPRSADPPAAIAGLYNALGRHAEAIEARERELVLTPQNGATYFAQAASHLLWRYDTAAARRELERGISVAGLSRMLRLPPTWLIDWANVLPAPIIATLDTLSRSGAASAFPGPLYDDMKVRLYMLTSQPERAKIFAESLVRVVAPLRSERAEAGLLLAPAYVALGRSQDARNESDTTYAYLERVAAPRRHIPGVITVIGVDMAAGRFDLALERLERLTKLRSGFYISPAVLRNDPRWATLRTRPDFERVVSALR